MQSQLLVAEVGGKILTFLYISALKRYINVNNEAVDFPSQTKPNLIISKVQLKKMRGMFVA